MTSSPHIYRADIDRVIDGDTVVMTIDLGFRVRATHSIRLAGIDAPEIFRGDEEERSKGRLAKAFVLNWVSQVRVRAEEDPWPFILHSEKGDSFGRWIGRIWEAKTWPDSTDLNEELVVTGHAVFSER